MTIIKLWYFSVMRFSAQLFFFYWNAVGKWETKMSRFYEIGRSNQKTFFTKNVGNDEKTKPYFMTSWPKILNDLITRQFPLKLEHTSYYKGKIIFCSIKQICSDLVRGNFFPFSFCFSYRIRKEKLSWNGFLFSQCVYKHSRHKMIID